MEEQELQTVPFKSQKPKKPRTEAQKASTAKALAVLKEKREALRKAEEAELADKKEEEREQIVQQRKEKHQKAKLPPVVEYITKRDLELFKKEIFTHMPREVVREVPVEKEVIREKVVPVEKQVVRERIVEQAIPVPVVKHLTGNELLDKLFFNK